MNYKNGAPPKLRFENENGDKDAIRIDNWKTEDMIAYVKVRVRGRASSIDSSGQEQKPFACCFLSK